MAVMTPSPFVTMKRPSQNPAAVAVRRQRPELLGARLAQSEGKRPSVGSGQRAFPRGWASARPHVAALRAHSGRQELEAKWVQRNLSQTRHREHRLEPTGWTGHTHVLQEKWAPVLTEGHTPGPGAGQAEDCTPVPPVR